jgi:hypothetical protein
VARPHPEEVLKLTRRTYIVTLAEIGDLAVLKVRLDDQLCVTPFEGSPEIGDRQISEQARELVSRALGGVPCSESDVILDTSTFARD